MFSATAIIRLLLFPVVVKAQKNMVGLNRVQPEFQRRQAQVMDSNLTREERNWNLCCQFFLQLIFALLSFKLRRKISYVKWMILCYFCSVFLQECFKIFVNKLTKPCFSNNYHYICLEIKHNVFRCSSPRRIYSVHDWERHQSDAHLHSYAGPSSRLHVHVI